VENVPMAFQGMGKVILSAAKQEFEGLKKTSRESSKLNVLKVWLAFF
jgi:hypothetical protein